MDIRKQKSFNGGFTLVELIVVITILAILGTIAFISLQGYSRDSRDSVRLSDMGAIKSSLELYKLDAGKYPQTTNGTIITYTGSEAWTQGVFGEATFKNVAKLDEIPLDPLTVREYIYSITNSKQEYQIAGIFEGDGLGLTKINKTYAIEKTALLRVDGNYNGKLLKVTTGSIDYVLAVPSIITSTGGTLEYIIDHNKLAYNGYKNLPFQYKNSGYNVDGETTPIVLVNSGSLVVYQGDVKLLDVENNSVGRKTFIEKLQDAYLTTELVDEGPIRVILANDNDDFKATELLSSTIVRNNLGGKLIVSEAVAPISSGSGTVIMLSQNMGSYNCALYSAGNIKCWGKNDRGQLGNSSTTNSLVPVDVIGITNASVIIGGDSHNGALLSDGTVKTWGANEWGQLGDGSIIDKITPFVIPGLSNVTKLVEGFALINDGTVKYWGPNVTSKAGVSNVISLTKAESHKCVLINNGTIKCWGENWDGRLGDGSFTSSLIIPVTVAGISTATKIFTGNDHTCAILSDKTVKCWGYNGEGELGDSSFVNKPTPVVVPGLTNVESIAAGYRHNIALLSDGTVKTWGLNTYGQLGDGTTTDSNEPTTVPGISGVVGVYAGFAHTCVLLNTGGSKCWGFNDSGQLGNGTTTDSYIPVDVLGL